MVGFGLNEDGNCFPRHDSCPDGYHTTEEDETGECNPNIECDDSEHILVNDGQSCREIKIYCLETPAPAECKNDKEDNESSQLTAAKSETAEAGPNRFSPIGGGIYFLTESVPNPEFGPLGVMICYLLMSTFR